MTLIPHPHIPNYAGVPNIPRTGPGLPSINVSLDQVQEWVNQSTGELPWGIYTQANQPIYSPTEGGTLSVVSFGFTRSMSVSSFPIEANNTNQGAAFASFNKVFQPSNPIIVLALSGTDSEKIAFLKAIDDACTSTAIYNVYTPDAAYFGSTGGCTLERYSYQRSAIHNATMLTVEVSLKQILQVTAALSNSTISAPQSPSASTVVNTGNNQTSTVTTSMLAKWFGGSVGVK